MVDFYVPGRQGYVVSFLVLRIFQRGAERCCQGHEDIVTGVPGARFENAAVSWTE